MHVQNADLLMNWLVSKLENLCEADPGALAKYVIALVRKDKPEEVLRKQCIDQLQVFFIDSTEEFVDTLLDAVRHNSYSSQPASRGQSEQQEAVLHTGYADPAVAGMQQKALSDPSYAGSSVHVKQEPMYPVKSEEPQDETPPASPEEPDAGRIYARHDSMLDDVEDSDDDDERDFRRRSHKPKPAPSSAPSSRSYNNRPLVPATDSYMGRKRQSAEQSIRQPYKSQRSNDSRRVPTPSVTAAHRPHPAPLMSAPPTTAGSAPPSKLMQPPPQSKAQPLPKPSNHPQRSHVGPHHNLPLANNSQQRPPMGAFSAPGGAQPQMPPHRAIRSRLGGGGGGGAASPSLTGQNMPQHPVGLPPPHQSLLHGAPFAHGTPGGSLDPLSSVRPVPATAQVVAAKPAPKPRCRDYDEKGYCLKGDACQFDHGTDPVVMDANGGVPAQTAKPPPPALPSLLGSGGSAVAAVAAAVAAAAAPPGVPGNRLPLPPPQSMLTNPPSFPSLHPGMLPPPPHGAGIMSTQATPSMQSAPTGMRPPHAHRPPPPAHHPSALHAHPHHHHPHPPARHPHTPHITQDQQQLGYNPEQPSFDSSNSAHKSSSQQYTPLLTLRVSSDSSGSSKVVSTAVPRQPIMQRLGNRSSENGNTVTTSRVQPSAQPPMANRSPRPQYPSSSSNNSSNNSNNNSSSSYSSYGGNAGNGSSGNTGTGNGSRSPGAAPRSLGISFSGQNDGGPRNTGGDSGGRRIPFKPSDTILLRRVPPELNDLAKLGAHFQHFGRVLNIEVGALNDPQCALIKFSTPFEAKTAHSSPMSVLNNRFIRVMYYNEGEHTGADGNSKGPMHAGSAASRPTSTVAASTAAMSGTVPPRAHPAAAAAPATSPVSLPPRGSTSLSRVEENKEKKRKELLQKNRELMEQKQLLLAKMLKKQKSLLEKKMKSKEQAKSASTAARAAAQVKVQQPTKPAVVQPPQSKSTAKPVQSKPEAEHVPATVKQRDEAEVDLHIDFEDGDEESEVSNNRDEDLQAEETAADQQELGAYGSEKDMPARDREGNQHDSDVDGSDANSPAEEREGDRQDTDVGDSDGDLPTEERCNSDEDLPSEQREDREEDEDIGEEEEEDLEISVESESIC